MPSNVDFTTSLTALLQRATDSIIDDIAKDGLSALKHSLDDAGFGEFESLKNYEIFAHVQNGEITFEIQVEFDAIDEESKTKLRPRLESQSRIRRTAKSYAFSGIGGTKQRIVGRRNAKTPMTDSGKKIHDARRPAREVSDSRKGSEERLADHELHLRAPRGISITKQGKLSIALQRTIQQTERGIRLPQSDFDGVLKDFMSRLQSIISEKFAPKLEEIMGRSINK